MSSMRTSRAFSLLELLVALTLLSIGVLAIAKYQISLIQKQNQLHARYIALFETDKLAALLSHCQGALVCREIINSWQEKIKQQLPNLRLSFNHFSNLSKINLQWDIPGDESNNSSPIHCKKINCLSFWIKHFE